MFEYTIPASDLPYLNALISIRGLFERQRLKDSLAFKREVAYNFYINQVAKSPLSLLHMPARPLNDFFAGFFYGQNKADLEVNMLITKQKGQRKGDVKEVKVKGESNQEKEVIVHHEAIPQRRGKSTWNWHEEFTLEWNKNFIIKDKKRNPR